MRSVAKSFISRNEIIMRSLPRFSEPATVVKTFNQFVSESVKGKHLKDNHSKELFFFPIRKFRIFPKAMIKTLIKTSYEAFNPKYITVHHYNNMLQAYNVHNIELEITDFLNDMGKNNIKPNYATYFTLMSLYAKRGDMDSVQNLINALKDKPFTMPTKLKSNIYAGYIRAGKLNEAENYLREECLDANSSDHLYQKALALADTCNVKDLLETIKALKETNIDRIDNAIGRLYRLLLKAGGSDSELAEVVALVENFNCIDDWIFHLNRDGFYNQSLKLLNEFQSKALSSELLSEMVLSFNHDDCPINTYVAVLDLFVDHIHFRVQSLFKRLDFNSSLQFCLKHKSVEGIRILACNLLVKSASNNSTPNMNMALEFAFESLQMSTFNVLIQFVFIPHLLENGIVQDPKEVIAMLPRFGNQLAANVYMHYLSRGDFDSFESLLKIHPIYDVNYANFSRSNPTRILENVSIMEIHKLASALSKVYSAVTVQRILMAVIIEKIIMLHSAGNIDEINHVIKLSKDLNLRLTTNSVERIANYDPMCVQYFNKLDRDTEEPEADATKATD